MVKTILCPDARLARGLSRFYTIKSIKTPIFSPQGPSADDISQNALGDCDFLCVLKSIARNNPAFILNSIVEDGNSIRIRLFSLNDNNVMEEEWYQLDKTIISYYSDDVLGHKAPWVYLFEKAFAFYRLQHPEVMATKKNIDDRKAFNYQKLLKGGYVAFNLEIITGVPAEIKSIHDFSNNQDACQKLYREIYQYIQNNFIICISTKKDKIKNQELSNKHSFEVINCYQKNGRYYLLLGNPVSRTIRYKEKQKNFFKNLLEPLGLFKDQKIIVTDIANSDFKRHPAQLLKLKNVVEVDLEKSFDYFDNVSFINAIVLSPDETFLFQPG